jgi:adenine-specific DNA methylase
MINNKFYIMPSKFANDNINNKLRIMDKIKRELKSDIDDFISCNICDYMYNWNVNRKNVCVLCYYQIPISRL